MSTRILLLLIMFCACANLQAAVDYKQQGQALCAAGRYAEAVPLLEKAVAQNRRSGAWWYLAIARQHLYDFEGAIEAAEAYRAVLRSEEWIERADSLLAECHAGQRAFEHTLDVVIADSMRVARQTFFEHYCLSNESGRIVASDAGRCFETQSGDLRIFPHGTGFAQQRCFQGQWDDVQPMEGVGSDAFRVLDPFMLTDGETLYFACDSTPGIGGLDIYRTSFDAGEERFYQPERLGMPFNSPYDDYMMAIDEAHKVGWWATERNAVEDSVMIYVFVYDTEEHQLEDPTVSRARIDCIRETWREAEGYAALLEPLYHPQEVTSEAERLHIVIAEGVVYTDVSQFRSAAASDAYQASVRVQQQRQELVEQVGKLRTKYHVADPAHRPALATQITDAEERLISLVVQAHRLELDYRRFENAVIQ